MLLWRSHDSGGAHQLPRGFLSMSPPFRNDALPLESIALLPGSSGSQGLLQHTLRQTPRVRRATAWVCFWVTRFLTSNKSPISLRTVSYTHLTLPTKA